MRFTTRKWAAWYATPISSSSKMNSSGFFGSVLGSGLFGVDGVGAVGEAMSLARGGEACGEMFRPSIKAANWLGCCSNIPRGLSSS